jgi:hypothetical protein
VESRFAQDIRDVPSWVSGGATPNTVERGDFREERLRTLRTRLSAAYKGVHALLMRFGAEDFRSGQPFDHAVFFDDKVDIHHIFPEAWCKSKGVKPEVYNSIINKTPISARTNRSLQGDAPSVYLARLEKGTQINPPIPADSLTSILRSHQIDVRLLKSDDFSGFFDERRERLLKMIEEAMHKPAVREDVVPPDPHDSIGEDEQEAERQDAATSEVSA